MNNTIFKFGIFILLMTVICVEPKAQSVAIGTTSPNAAAILDVTATDKGMLVPRVALVSDSNPISAPKPSGLLVWNTNSGFKSGTGFYFWNGATWINLSQVVNSLNNAGIVPAPTVSNRAKSWSTDHQGNPAWRRPNKTMEYINNF